MRAEEVPFSSESGPAGDESQIRSTGSDRRRTQRPFRGTDQREGPRRAPGLEDPEFEDFSHTAFSVALKAVGDRRRAAQLTRELFHAVRSGEAGREVRRRLADVLDPPTDPVTTDPVTTDPRTGPTVSVVIPTLNEAANLPGVLARLPDWIHEVIVVDGHSTDDTIEVAKEHWPGVKIVEQDGIGKGNALTCGFRAVTGEITVMLDADGSTDAAEVPRFVAALTGGFDFAKGSRFMTGGGSADITPLRRFGNWVITKVVNRLWGVKYSDLCYGYNAFWTHLVPPSFADTEGFEVETLMNIRVAASDIKVIEVPSYERSRVSGDSNLKVGRDGRRIFRTIVAEWIRP